MLKQVQHDRSQRLKGRRKVLVHHSVKSFSSPVQKEKERFLANLPINAMNQFPKLKTVLQRQRCVKRILTFFRQLRLAGHLQQVLRHHVSRCGYQLPVAFGYNQR